MVDLWLMDDETMFCDPVLVPAVLDAVDGRAGAPERGGERNVAKTHAIYYATDAVLKDNHD
eukprot:4953360-Lingulodinium_polyedra.AAC.1